MSNEPEQTERRIPVSFDAWLKDDTALPIGYREETSDTLNDAVNDWIEKHPGKKLPPNFVVSHYAKIVCETPRSLPEFRDEDK